AALPAVVPDHVISRPDRRTPTYTKPMLSEPGRPPRELNRLDIKNRTPLPAPGQDAILTALRAGPPGVGGLILLHTVSEEDCGVVTAAVREELALHFEDNPTQFALADSRERIDRFRAVCVKPNSHECLRAVGRQDDSPAAVAEAARALAARVGAVVFCTQ